MKFKKILLLILPLLLVSCKNNAGTIEDDSILKLDNDITIMTPTGAPSLIFYTEVKNTNLTTTNVASNIIASMSKSNAPDFVVLPINAGINLLRNNSAIPYKLASIVTFGNYYLASTGNDNNNQLDVGDRIVLFQQNNTPDYLFHYIYGNEFDSYIEWVNSVNDAARCLITGKNDILGADHKVDYVLLAEPALTNALNKNSNASIYKNMQDLYIQKSQNTMFVQAGLFVNTNNSKEKIIRNLNAIKNNIEYAICNPLIVKQYLDLLSEEDTNLKYGIASSSLVVSCLTNNNSIAIGYENAYSNKQNIDSILNLFNIGASNEEVYFK